VSQKKTFHTLCIRWQVIEKANCLSRGSTGRPLVSVLSQPVAEDSKQQFEEDSSCCRNVTENLVSYLWVFRTLMFNFNMMMVLFDCVNVERQTSEVYSVYIYVCITVSVCSYVLYHWYVAVRTCKLPQIVVKIDK